MQHRKHEPWLYLAPALVMLLAVFGYPIVRLVILSLQRTQAGTLGFVGLGNYELLFRDDVFLQAVRNNLKLLLTVPVTVVFFLMMRRPPRSTR